MTSIAIAGDIYPGLNSTHQLRNKGIEKLFDGLLPILQESQLCVANLEGPLVDEPSPLPKVGPVHTIDPRCVQGFAKAGLNLLNLGNNHAMDHGGKGLKHTLRICSDYHMETVGAGESLKEAGAMNVQQVGGRSIGFLSYTEHEFGIATGNSPGTNPLDLIHFIRTVEERKHELDCLVVLLHGGNEYYPYPRPRLREMCRFMVEQGADAVILQHSHCPGCYERHAGGIIVYGQGNFLFDDRSSRPCEQEGFVVVLKLEKGKPLEFEPVPFKQSKEKPGPRRMEPEESKLFLIQFEERSMAILQPGFVEKQWKAYCQENSRRYLSLLHGYSRRVRELDMKFGFLRKLYKKDRLRMLMHLMRCETHRETIIQILEQEVGG